jgi:hypothetical protein
MSRSSSYNLTRTSRTGTIIIPSVKGKIIGFINEINGQIVEKIENDVLNFESERLKNIIKD